MDEYTALGVYTILDVHNYGRYSGIKLGTDPVTPVAFANLWQQLAKHFKDNPTVIFGLMNEPNNQNSNAVVAAYNEAIKRIRRKNYLITLF